MPAKLLFIDNNFPIIRLSLILVFAVLGVLLSLGAAVVIQRTGLAKDYSYTPEAPPSSAHRP